MIIVVFDTNVIISAIFWPHSTARRALTGLARRQYAAAISRELLDEYGAVARRFREQFPRVSPAGALGWLQAKCLWVEPVPLGEPRSRDPKMILCWPRRWPLAPAIWSLLTRTCSR